MKLLMTWKGKQTEAKQCESAFTKFELQGSLTVQLYVQQDTQQ